MKKQLTNYKIIMRLTSGVLHSIECHFDDTSDEAISISFLIIHVKKEVVWFIVVARITNCESIVILLILNVFIVASRMFQKAIHLNHILFIQVIRGYPLDIEV